MVCDYWYISIITCSSPQVGEVGARAPFSWTGWNVPWAACLVARENRAAIGAGWIDESMWTQGIPVFPWRFLTTHQLGCTSKCNEDHETTERCWAIWFAAGCVAFGLQLRTLLNMAWFLPPLLRCLPFCFIFYRWRFFVGFPRVLKKHPKHNNAIHLKWMQV